MFFCLVLKAFSGDLLVLGEGISLWFCEVKW